MSRRRPTSRSRQEIPAVAPRARNSDNTAGGRNPGAPATGNHRATRTTRTAKGSTVSDSELSSRRSKRAKSQRRSLKTSSTNSSSIKAGKSADSATRSATTTASGKRNKKNSAAAIGLTPSPTRTDRARRSVTTSAKTASATRSRPPLTTVPDLGSTRTDRARRTISKRSTSAPRVTTTSPAAPKSRVPFKRYVHAPPPPPVFTYTEEHARRRMIAVMGLVVIVLLLVLGRVGALQTTGGEALRDAASRQWTRTRTVPAARGSIFDRNGEELAVSVPAYAVSVNPKLIKDDDAVASLLSTALGLTEGEVAKLRTTLADKSRGFAYVKHQVDLDVGKALISMKVPGVNVDPEDRRVLPGGDTGRSVIGRTDVFGDGIAGLELQYNDMLKGADGKVSREVAPQGNSIAGSEQVVVPPVPGEDIVLTLDRSIQFSTEQVLAERVQQLNAKSGTVIVMDTKTGDVYAMASVGRNDDGSVTVSSGNFAAVDAYEPGSVVKVITAAAGLDAGAVTPDTTFLLPYRRQFNGHWLSDSHQHPDEVLNVNDILVQSSNMGTISIMEELGRQEHWEYMRKFGLGEKTALDFPNESSGILHPWNELFGTEPYTVAYGQGVASTSIQLVAAVNTIANDGVYVAPRLVSGTVDANGAPIDKAPATSYKVVGEQAAVQTQRILRNVVCSGTGQLAQEGITEFTVAGKTGTGYKAQPNGTYLDENGNYVYYASFVGFFPAEDPRVTVLVSIDEPPEGSDDRYGGTAAAPVFAKLAPTIVSELGIIPPKNPVACPSE